MRAKRGYLAGVAACAALLAIGVTGASAAGQPMPSRTTVNSSSAGAAAARQIAAHRVIVRFRRSADAGERRGAREAAGTGILTTISGVSGLQVVTVDPGQTAVQAAAALNASDHVLYAQPDVVRRISDAVPDDEFFDRQWGMQNVGQDPDGTCVPDPNPDPPDESRGCDVAGTAGADINWLPAWNTYTAACGITNTPPPPCAATVVGIGDTGFDANHEDLSANVWQNQAEVAGVANVDDDVNGYKDDTQGWDWTSGNGSCASGDNNPVAPHWDGTDADESYHATHVASIVGAVTNNGKGVAGVDPYSQLMNLRIFDTHGFVVGSTELCAMSYAATNGAKVYNGSYGGGVASQAESDFIAAHPDMLFVFAAGNAGPSSPPENVDVDPEYPCAYDPANIICVAASDDFDDLAYFSFYGANTVDLAAPGQTIAGAVNDADPDTGIDDIYAFLDGTSMATPFVSGAAAMIMSRYSNLSVAEVKAAILGGVDQKPAFNCKTLTGGRLDLDNSLNIAAAIAGGGTPPEPPDGCVPVSVSPGTGGSPGSGTPSNPAVTAGPDAIVIAPRRKHVSRTGAFSFYLLCPDACSYNFTVVAAHRAGSFRGRGWAAAGKLIKVAVRPTHRARRKLLRAMRRHKLKVRIALVARNDAGVAGKKAKATSYLTRKRSRLAHR